MVHFTCDLCGRSIEGLRFSVAIEICRHDPPENQPAADPDQDSLDQIEDNLLQLETTADFFVPEPVKKQIHKDLCPTCAQRFEKDPLARDNTQRFNASSN